MSFAGKRTDRYRVLVSWQVIAETAVDNIGAPVCGRRKAAKYGDKAGGYNNLNHRKVVKSILCILDSNLVCKIQIIGNKD